MSRRLFWDAFVRSRWIQAVALTLVAAMFVVQCGREGGAARDLANLNYDSLPRGASHPVRPADKLHQAAGELKALLAIQRKRDLSGTQAAKARATRGRLGTALRALERQFGADRSKLEHFGAEGALARLGRITERTTKLERTLDAALAHVPANGGRAQAAAGEATKALARLSPEKPQQPLSSHLGFGIDNAPPRAPALSAGITPAYAAPTASEAPSELPRTPEQEDLAQTSETTVTPAVDQLAKQLHGDPVEIYEWVRNEIRFEPYYGIRKGADLTYLERSGSAADQAALLIALLRASGIHARFVQGVAQLPAATAANWLGIDTDGGESVEAAPDILASGGIPTTQVRAGGKLVRVKFEHVWAEAYVPNDAYRGAEEGRGGKTWLPLDPSIKPNDFSARRDGLREALRPPTEDFVRDLATDTQTVGQDAVVAPPQAEFQDRTTQFLQQQQDALRGAGLKDGENVAAAIGGQEVVPTDSSYLPATTPFKEVSVAGERRALPDSLSAHVDFEVSGSDPLSMPNPDPDAPDAGFTYTAKTMDLANKRVTVAYVPATSEDAEIIDAYHGLLNGPTYAAALIPVLRVDGRVVARGHQAVSTGYTQRFRIVYRMPGYAPEAVENPLDVGSLSAVSIDVGRKSVAQLKRRAEAVNTDGATTDNLLTDARFGEMLSILGDVYFARNDRHNAFLADMARVDARRSLSGGIVATGLRTTYVAGFPVSTALSGPTFDVDEDSQSVTNLTDDERAPEAYMRASGLNTSLAEGQVLETFFHAGAVSTTKILALAAQQGTPVYQIDSSNIDRVAPELTISAAAIAEIRVAVSQGATVMVPRSNVTVGGWTGTGYVVMNGTSSDYRIFGGASGGALIPFPVFPTNQPTFTIFLLKQFGLISETMAGCLGLMFDLATIWIIGADFFGAAGGYAAAVEMIALGPGLVLTPFALTIIVLFTAALLMLSILFALNNGYSCFTGIKEELDEY